MSAFDDEFGLFGEGGEEDERKSTLGARKIASDETIIDDIEPEDERPPRRRPSAASDRSPGRRPFTALAHPARRSTHREPADPVAAQQRAGELLAFLAKNLVTNTAAVGVESFPAEQGDPPVLELTVDPEDLGKVIGRSGRVAQALRTIVRATAEGRISVDILDTDEYEDDDLDPGEPDAESDVGEE